MTVSKGSKVSVEYTGTLEDGTVFDSTKYSQPLEFTVGEKEVISGFDHAVLGMKLNEEKNISLKPQQAYGPHNAALVKEIALNQLPENAQVGHTHMGELHGGAQIPITIINIKEDLAIVDLNHPLAGKNLNFKIKIIEIK